MNLRCIYCQTPFTLSRMEKLAAIQKLQAENLHHHDAFCPRCRRSNPVSIQRLQIFTPGWQEGLRTLEAEATIREKEMAPSLAAALAPAKSAPSTAAPAKKHHHSSKASKAEAASSKASKAKPAAAKKAAAKPATAKKSSAKPASAKSKKPAAKPAAKTATKSKRK